VDLGKEEERESSAGIEHLPPPGLALHVSFVT